MNIIATCTVRAPIVRWYEYMYRYGGTRTSIYRYITDYSYCTRKRIDQIDSTDTMIVPCKIIMQRAWRDSVSNPDRMTNVLVLLDASASPALAKP